MIRPTLVLALILGAWIPCAFADQPPSLENDSLRAAFEPSQGRLVQYTAKSLGVEFLSTPANAFDLWEISLLQENAEPLRPAQAKHFSWAAPDAASLELAWQDFGRAETPELRVIAQVSLDPVQPRLAWIIRVENIGDAPIAILRFPRIGPIAPRDPEVLAVPVWMGECTRKARQLLAGPNGEPRRLEWEYPGILSLQCLAFYQENGPGLCLAADDNAARRKHFAVLSDGKGNIGLEILQFPESRGSYASPYHVTLNAFSGDWISVAEQYRSWALQQSWARDSRLRQGKTPPWVADTALWIWNRGRSENVLAPAQALQEPGFPVSVFWHWWHGCSYDVGFPEYLPPRQGEESFRAALDAAHQNNIHALVYMNQRLWGMTTKSWTDEQAERYAVKNAQGKVQPEVYNTFTKAPCASMCMGTQFWRQKYAGLASDAWNVLGVDGIYMDQACSSLACYDPAHGHPLGGGAYWMQGFQLLAADIRQRCSGPRAPIALAGEGCGEAWLPHLDLMLSLQVSMERYANPGDWEPIPFFHAVYHGYAVFFGNYSSLTMPPYDDLWPTEFAPKEPLALLDRKFTRQFRMEQARAFVWGQQPSLANFKTSLREERREEIDFVLQLARLHQQARPYLLHGTFLRPPAITIPSARFDMSRLSIYAGQQNALREFQKEYPLILTGAWRNADGNVALVLVNLSDDPQPVHIIQNTAAWALPDAGAIRRIDIAGPQPLADYQHGTIDVQLDLPPAAAQILEFSPKPNAKPS